jgi:hypothetical protein
MNKKSSLVILIASLLAVANITFAQSKLNVMVFSKQKVIGMSRLQLESPL